MLGVRYPMTPFEKMLKFDCPMSSLQMMRMLGFPPVSALFEFFGLLATLAMVSPWPSLRPGSFELSFKNSIGDSSTAASRRSVAGLYAASESEADRPVLIRFRSGRIVLYFSFRAFSGLQKR